MFEHEETPVPARDGERSLVQLAADITGAAVRLAAATAAWLILVAEFDRRQGWAGPGMKSCAHWLAWQCGLSPGAAREHVRVARALGGLPRIAAAFAAGRISYAKVRALTRVADPSCEGDLLELALHTTASQVEHTVRAWRRAEADDTESLAARQHFEYWWDDDGMLVFRGRVNPDDGARLVAAIESVVERDARRERAARKRAAGQAAAERAATRHTEARHTEARHTEARATPAVPVAPGSPAAEALRCADSADELADELAVVRRRTAARRCAALARLASAAADADRRAGDPPRREVVLHVDTAVLADDAAAGRAHLDGGPALSRRQVLRMACEATAVVMLESGGEPLAVGRRRRYATRAQRLALLRRDGGCARPGCDETRIERLHAHHLRHWLHGGRTDLANLVLLCDTDHGLAHDLDLVMTRRAGELIASTPEGRRVWGRADAAFAGGIAGLGAPAALFPDGEPRLADSLAVGGERMDLRYVVGVLMTDRDVTRRLAEQNGVELAA